MSFATLCRSLLPVVSARVCCHADRYLKRFNTLRVCFSTHKEKRMGREQPVDSETAIPVAPGLDESDLEFIKRLPGVRESGHSNLPDPPDMTEELGPNLAQELPWSERDDDEEILDDDNSMPPVPPSFSSNMFVTTGTSPVLFTPDSIDDSMGDDAGISAFAAAVKRASGQAGCFRGPMPLHELANRSVKVQELVKLGIDLWMISLRHGDLERLLHLNLESQIKPQIRLLVDLGFDPDRLGFILTRATKLLWTDGDDLRTRRNYLDAKLFTEDMIKIIFRFAPYWLTLSTKDIDYRLGFIQKTFQLQGSEVRELAVQASGVITTRKWQILVNSIKLAERQLGFSKEERKQIALSQLSCYIHPILMQDAFDYLHGVVGLPRSQLAQHPRLLITKVDKIKRRHQFLKFLKRDTFDPTEPGYISPSWFEQNTEEEFCQQAAKRTLEEYELFLRTL